MRFTYSYQCGPSYYSEQTDEDFYDEEDFEYEVDYDEALDAAAEILVNNYIPRLELKNKPKETQKLAIKAALTVAKNILSDFDIGIEEQMYDELKEYFEDEAADAYRDR